MTSDHAKPRINSIDVMRGLVMLIMLLDHVRERFFLHQQVSDPMDISQTEPALYFSRLAAHLCAPVFIFLTGLSAWLYQQTGRPLTPFLLKRGLVLILLELTLVNFSWMGAYHTLWLQVIWVIGLCMLVLALLHHLPRKLLLLLGVVLVAGHNLLTPISFLPTDTGYSLWTLLHDRGYVYQGELLAIKVSYPLLPWIGVILLGFAAGPLYSNAVKPQRRQQLLLQAGLGALILLLLLRGSNIYGETLPWQTGETMLQSLMSFFNFSKYPPSLDFLLLTLGLMSLLLCFIERAKAQHWQPILANFGAAPMFFYLLHLYALLLLYWLAVALFGTNQGDLFGVPSMQWIWCISMILAITLYPLTRWFAGFKRQSQWRWLRYL
jgi:uncharacterized membrane protein